jgi:FkbM family methyltransferase
MFRGLRRRLQRNRSTDPLGQVLTEFGDANPRASFVQVGSNDGTHLDPLHEEIVARKWTGVMIEPVPYLFDRLRRSYSAVEGIRFLNAAISDHNGTQRLYYLPEDPDNSTLPPWYDTLASFRKDVILRHQKEIPDIEERLAILEVPCITFETLCRDQEIESVDLIHIDTEGYDFEIIKSIDFGLLRPKIVIFEHYHLDLNDYTACTDHLGSLGYEHVSIGMDTICLDPLRLDRGERRLRRLWQKLRADPPAFAFR